METIIYGAQISGVILVVVFVVVILLQGVISLLVQFDQWLTRSRIEPESVSTSAPDQLSPELLAVITAAAMATTDKKVRVKSIRYRREPPGSSWVVQGRAAVMASHKVKP